VGLLCIRDGEDGLRWGHRVGDEAPTSPPVLISGAGLGGAVESPSLVLVINDTKLLMLLYQV
jgi:hypothetical protein